jgi:hypothetical protein
VGAPSSGKTTTATGTVDVIRVASRFSLLGCITPFALREHSTYMAPIGGRFLMYQMPTLTQEQTRAGMRLATQFPDEQQQSKALLLDLVGKQLGLAETITTPATMTPRAEQLMQAMALLVAGGRGDIRDGEVTPESPYRVHHQIVNLARSIARVSGHERVEASDLELVRKVAVGSLPNQREKILGCLAHQPEGLTALDAQRATGLKSDTAPVHLNELCMLGL